MTDRRQAISLVEAALKSGRIVQADHDMRLDQIKHASSQQDVDLVVRDLQHSATAAAAAAAAPAVTAGAPPGGGQPPWPLVNYGPGQHAPDSAQLQALTKTRGKAIGGVIAAIVVLSVIVPIAGVIIGLVSARDTFDDLSFAEPVDETTYLPGQEPGEHGVNVLTIDGYDDLVVALDDATGSTLVFSAVLYPRYAVLSVPEKETGKRYRSYYWDGHTLVANDIKSTSDAPRVDLESVAPDVIIGLVDDVRGRVEDVTTWYATINSIASEGPRLSAYASNEYGEGAYLIATLQGEITYESTYGD